MEHLENKLKKLQETITKAKEYRKKYNDIGKQIDALERKKKECELKQAEIIAEICSLEDFKKAKEAAEVLGITVKKVKELQKRAAKKEESETVSTAAESRTGNQYANGLNQETA